MKFNLLLLGALSFSSLSISEEIILKCESIRAFDKSWPGNIQMVKIRPSEKIVLTRDLNTSESSVGWSKYDITTINEFGVFFRNACDSTACEDYQFYSVIDRNSGFYDHMINSKDPLTSGWSYMCQKSEKLF
jgi:hypothetical protein